MKKIRFNSPVVLGFTILSAAVLVLNYITGGASNAKLFCIYRTSLTDPLFYLRLFTHVLGHSDLQHYTSNMILFLLTGPLLEEKYGSKRLLSVIAIVAVITGIVHVIVGGNTGLLGASGIVFAFILLASITGTGKGIPLTMIIVAAFYITQQVVQGFSADNVSQLTHIVGGTVGAIYGLTIRGKGR